MRKKVGNLQFFSKNKKYFIDNAKFLSYLENSRSKIKSYCYFYDALSQFITTIVFSIKCIFLNIFKDCSGR